MKIMISSLILPIFLLLNSNSLRGMENTKEHQDILNGLALTLQKPDKFFVSEILEALTFVPQRSSMENDAYAMEQSLKNEHKEILKTLTLAHQRPNETCISMWDFGSTTSLPTAKSPVIISTNGLGGCLATALHIKYNNGEQYAGITHYPPLSDKEQQNNLKTLCLQALKGQNKTKKIIATNFFFVAPKEESIPSPSSFPLGSFPNSMNGMRGKILECIVKMELDKTGKINSHYVTYDMFNSCLNAQKDPDIEITLHPNDATIRIKNKTTNL